MNRSTAIAFIVRSMAAFLAVMALLAGTANAETEVNTGYFGDVAIQGYDTVAYFTEHKATPGKEELTHEWLGAKWRFSSQKHLDLFANDPQRYAPQYGGHCATGLAVHGNLTKDIDPHAWVIIDGKLYFNYSKGTQELLTDGVISLDKAERNWKKAEKLSN